MLIGTHRKAEAAPRGTASLLLQHMVDELKVLYAKFYKKQEENYINMLLQQAVAKTLSQYGCSYPVS